MKLAEEEKTKQPIRKYFKPITPSKPIELVVRTSPAPIIDTISRKNKFLSKLRDIDTLKADSNSEAFYTPLALTAKFSPELPALALGNLTPDNDECQTSFNYPAMFSAITHSPEMLRYKMFPAGALSPDHQFVRFKQQQPMTARGRPRPSHLPDFKVKGTKALIIRKAHRDLDIR